MPDYKNTVGPRDASRVNINEAYEVQYWTSKFNCTKEQLTQAVKAVGPNAGRVGEYLRTMK